MSATSSNKGFTLLEVLIALVLLAVLASALYGSYFAVVRARDRAAEGMEARRELGSTLELLRREISSSVFSISDKQRLRFVVEDRDNFGKPASNLELTTLAPLGLLRKESGIVAVKYQMLEKDKQMILTRREQDLFFLSDTMPVYPQMEHVSAFLVECYDGSKWVKSWDTALNGRLPAKVRIKIQFLEMGKPVEFMVHAFPRITP
ncbi:MAG: type II secretion system protein GspJ [Deltaproteobacteria bacterium]